ncbi:unnamed protein product [Sympodiomycopsis kandeliae]
MNATASTSRLTPPSSPSEMQLQNTNPRRSISNSFRNILVPSTSTTNNTSHRRESSRRSIAHRPSLLGLDDNDDNQFRNNNIIPETDWHDVSLEFDMERDGDQMSQSTRKQIRRPSSSSSPHRSFSESIQLDHLQRKEPPDRQDYRIDDEHAFEGEEHSFTQNGYHTNQYGNKEADEEEEQDQVDDHLQSASVYTRLTGSDNQEEGAMAIRSLDFESLDKSEKWSYWVITVIVVLLSGVAVGIGSDWIDWPGDGIGKD